MDASSEALASGIIAPAIMDINATQSGHSYKLLFKADTVGHLKNERYRHPMDMQLVTSSYQVCDMSNNNIMVYEEKPGSFPEDNMVYDSDNDFWGFNGEKPIKSDIFEGIQLTMQVPDDSIQIDWVNTGWITGSSSILVESTPETKFFPWEYEIVFTDEADAYTAITTQTTAIKAPDGHSIKRDSLLLEQTYNFYVINKYSVDSTGAYEKVDLITWDLNESGAFEPDQDIILVGHSFESRSRFYWCGTIFTIDFRSVPGEEYMPAVNDVYSVKLTRPLTESDQLVFTIDPEEAADAVDIKTTMDSIKVVPNPYIATNAMETAVANKFLNQRRQIMFTHIPAQCDIRIFTSSGILVDHLEVDNEPSAGIVHWDVLSREGLEIAAGMYIFHVESRVTGDEKVGKFAVIK
jgi:hypothetical protein